MVEVLSLVARGEIVHPAVASLSDYYTYPGVTTVPLHGMPRLASALVWVTDRETAAIRAFAGRVRAAQAIAMLSDPVALFADAPTNALRASVLNGVRRLLDDNSESPAGSYRAAHPTGPTTGRASSQARNRRGRPSVMNPAMIKTAQHMHDTGRTAAEIATTLGVSRAKVYRHLPPSIE